MARNEFLGFATGNGANVLSQEEYAARPELSTGMTSGPAESKTCNKVWRQGANMAAAMGAFIKAQGYDALDDGDIETLSTALAAALAKLIPALATHTSDGLMSAADKVKVDSVHGVTAYSRTADYEVGDLVTYQGELYIAQVASGPSSGGPSVPNGNSNATWAPIWHVTANAAPNGRTGFMTADDKTKLNSFYGILPYDRTQTYAPGYVVYYLGSIYACIQMHTSSDPHAPTDTAYWQKVITAPMTGADGTNAGEAGLVPAPAAGDYGKFLRGDGMWTIAAPPMIGAHADAAGVEGLVPTPAAGDNEKFLRGDGTWQPAGGAGLPEYSANVDYPVNSAVVYDGVLRIAKVANGPSSTVAAPTNSNFWLTVYGTTIQKVNSLWGVKKYNTTDIFMDGEIVWYANELYICTYYNGGSFGAKTPGINGSETYWRKFSAHANDWANTINYTKGDIVMHNNSVWIALNYNGPTYGIGYVEPGTNAAYWKEMTPTYANANTTSY